MDDFVKRSCGKVKDPSPLPSDPTVAMAYVPFQQWGEIYESSKGLERGTIFPDLDKPFLCGRGDSR